jgi:hypothetical protein
MFCIYLSIFVSRENKRSTIEKEKEKQKERTGRQHNSAVDAASASSHHSVCLCLDEKQQ